MNKLSKIIEEYGQELTKKEINYLLSFDVKTSNFYGLPKVHKSHIISNLCKESFSSYVCVSKPEDLKLRPIVAGPSCETHRISNLLDLLLKPYVSKVKSYIRDTVDFLNSIPENVQPDAILVSFDVTNLYSNIPHELGLEAIEHWIDKFPDLLHDRFSKPFILQSLKFILEHNFMNFDGITYKQKLGTAMGTKVAPTYATLVLGFLEEKLYKNLEDQFSVEFTTFIQQSWKRFLDDCFIIWTKTKDELNKFYNILNNLNNHLKFTMDCSEQKLPFLDVMIIKREDKIITDIYYKPTDTK